MKLISKKDYTLEDFIKFGKTVFKPKKFFNILYKLYFLLNIFFLGILMPLSNNILSIILIIFFLLIGPVMIFQLIFIKYSLPWKNKKIRERYPEFFMKFNRLIKKDLDSEEIINKCYGWARKVSILDVFRLAQIILSFLLLSLYIPLILNFDLSILNSNHSPENRESLILSTYFLTRIIPLYLSIAILIFFFLFFDMYINRFRWLIEEIILWNYNELIKNKNRIINLSRDTENSNNIIEEIKDQMDKIVEFNSFEILGVLRDPDYGFDLVNLIDEDIFRTIEIVEDYQTFLISLRQEQKEFITLNKIQDCFDYLQNIKSRIIKEKSELKALISHGEGDKIEFKSSLQYDFRTGNKNRDLEFQVVKTIAGFLNSNGGTLFIGVKDDSTIIGLDNDYKLNKKKQNKDGFLLTLENVISNYFKKDINLYLKKSIELIDNKEICVIRVEKSDTPIYLKNGDIYIRTSAQTVKLNPEEAVNYIIKRFK